MSRGTPPHPQRRETRWPSRRGGGRATRRAGGATFQLSREQYLAGPATTPISRMRPKRKGEWAVVEPLGAL